MAYIFELNTIEKIKRFVGEGGVVPFEHGYPQPEIVNPQDWRVYRVTMVTDKEMHCTSTYGRKKNIKLDFEKATPPDTEKVYKALLEYAFYCQTEA